MEKKIRMEAFWDESGKIVQLPSKIKARKAVLEYLANKFESGVTYTEKQVNEICEQWHSFGDFFLLRRELVDYGFLGRQTDGSEYWRI